jgi:hypothetical protein
MRMIAALFVLAQVAAAQPQNTIDPAEAAAVFRLAQELSARDNGALWGRTLAGPMILVAPAARAAATNHADPDGQFTRSGEIFLGTLPASVGIANTAADWGGQRWTMMIWPLPEDRADRAVLVMHELWHRIQGDIGLPAADPSCAHLDTPDGRYWLRLEMRALARALAAPGAERSSAVADALAFRSARHGLFDGAAANETALENNEGLAEYTGILLGIAGSESQHARARAGLQTAEGRPSFVRSFAYGTGPAYCILLDDAGLEWRGTHTPSMALADRLAAALNISRIEKEDADRAAREARYDGAAIRAEEAARETRRQEQLADYRARLVTGPRLYLPLRSAQYEFDPRTVTPLDDLGSVYPWLTIRDHWGSLKVLRNGALLGREWNFVAAPAGKETPLKSPDWELTLAPGYEVVESEPGRVWTVRRAAK